MKVSLYAAAAFLAGIAAGRWMAQEKLAAEAAGEIAEARGYYKEKYEKQYRLQWEDSVRSFVRQWEGDEAANELKFKDGKPMLVDLMHTKEERDELSKVEETTVEAAKSLIEHNGYTSYNNMDKPQQPAGPTASTEGIRGPYIISQEEFFDRGLEKQNQITYYAGNDVLVSAKGKVVPEEDRVVLIGLDTLSKFGELSEDPNVVYVRNPNLGAGVDFEITLDEGDFHVVGGD